MRPSRTYSATVIHGGVDGSCGTTAMSRASSARRSSVTERPPSAISPANGTSRATARSSVVFPAPFGPISASHSPFATTASTRSTTGTPAELDRDPPQLDHAAAASCRPQDESEERRAEERGHHAERDLRRRERRPRDHVREHEEPRAHDDGQRDQRAVPDSGEEPDRVRDDDPDEADEPGDGDRRGSPERRRDDEREPHPADVDPEARRLVVAEVEHVDDAAQRDDHDDRDGDVREDEDDVGPARARDVPEDPRVDLLQRLRVLLLDERLPGREERRHRHAGEDQRRRVPLAARRAADRVREHHRDASRRRTPRPGAPAGRAGRPGGTRSRSSRRARRRPRRRAGTGSASGLRKTPWYVAPASASIAPTSAARITRGTRICQRIASSVGESDVEKPGTWRRAAADSSTAPTPRSTGPASTPTTSDSEEERHGGARPDRGQPASPDVGGVLRDGRHRATGAAGRARRTSRGRSSRAAAPSARRSSRRSARSSRCGRR